jgi:hypothetical protein
MLSVIPVSLDDGVMTENTPKARRIYNGMMSMHEVANNIGL